MHISGFQSLTLSDYPGKTAAIVFTSGCNFNCVYCHNRQLLAPQTGFCEKTILETLKTQRYFLEGLVITGGEPTLQRDLGAFIAEVKALGLSVKLDTNGSHPEVIQQLLRANLLDFIAMDLKASLRKYAAITQSAINCEHIKTSIALIAHSGLPHLFRTTYSEDLLSEANIAEIEQTLLPVGSPFVRQRVVP